MSFPLQDITITFDRNTAAAGDAIYSTDFDQCRFLGNASTSDFPYSASIFNIPPGYQSPFVYMWVIQNSPDIYITYMYVNVYVMCVLYSTYCMCMVVQ